MSEEFKKRSLNLFLAKASDDNDKTRVFEPTGEYLILKSHEGGYFTHAYNCEKDVDTTGVTAGQGKGYLKFVITDGSDEVGRELVDEWRMGRVEVIVSYREFQQENGGSWVNTKCVTAAGYISSCKLVRGESKIGVEVHTIRTLNENDAVGKRDFSVDCVNGNSTIMGGTLGKRQPMPIAPIADADSDNWDPPLMA